MCVFDFKLQSLELDSGDEIKFKHVGASHEDKEIRDVMRRNGLIILLSVLHSYGIS